MSLSWKLLLTLLGIMLLTLLGFSSLSLLHTNEHFSREQLQKKMLGKQYFDLYSSSTEQQLMVWMQSFAELQQLGAATDFTGYSVSLQQHFDTLQLYFSVEQLTLYDPAGQVLLHIGPALTDSNNQLAAKVAQLQQPQTDIHCQQHCAKIIGLPVLNGKGEVAVLLLSSALTEVFLRLHQALGAQVALLQFQPESDKPLTVLHASAPQLVTKLYQAMPKPIDVEKIINHGGIQRLEQASYAVQLEMLEATGDSRFLLLLIEDISNVVQQNQAYKQRILLVTLLCFILFLLLILFSTRRLTARIKGLSAALPLLARKQYGQFRNEVFSSPVRFRDEVSDFTDAVYQLSEELERLDTQLVSQTAALEKLALYDDLTGLGNRHLLRQMLQQYLQQQQPVGLLFLDLDKFQNINNSRTHVAGDAILQQMAARLLLMSPPKAKVYRLGGDEFALLWQGCSSLEALQQLAIQVHQSFSQNFSLPAGNVSLSASLGLCWRDGEAIPAEEMLRRADLAMYQAKQNGRNCFFSFTEQMLTELANRLQLEGELRQALTGQAFFLCLQPQVNLRTGKLSGFEALLRWRHPQRGIVPPDEFIPVLEQAQLMTEVGYWVFERGCQLCLQLIQHGLTDVCIAVNLSADQFTDPELPDRLAAILKRYQLSATHFELELTESTLVSQMHLTLQTMHLLKQQGFTFAIDDFGTGYSSLNYLTKMPVDTIKIDRSFVMRMLENGADFQIVISTIAMVQKLGLQVVAEGVETLEQLRLLQQYQCDFVQGYYFSRPVPEAELDGFIRQLQAGWPASLLIEQ